MADAPMAVELTTRDVLLQVDRRLSLLEEDLRGLDKKTESLEVRLGDKIEALGLRMDDKLDGLRREMAGQFSANLKWTLGTMIALAGLVVAVFKL